MIVLEILMPATTLRISARQKRRFAQLQAALSAVAGRRIKQSELMGLLLEQGEKSFLARADPDWRPLSKVEIDQVMSLPMDVGFEIGDVDEGVYGKRTRSRS